MKLAEFNIRKSTIGDIPSIANLCTQLGYPSSLMGTKKRLAVIQEKDDHIVIVAENQKSTLLGWIHVFAKYLPETDPYAEVGGLVIEEMYRGKGVGQTLLQAAEEWTINHGFSTIVIRSNTIRDGAFYFYTHNGYKLKKTQNVFTKGLE
jgi:GNAT superfamily N-acetyltransferase